MARPLSADQYLAVLKKSGIRVVEYGSRRTYNRDHKGAWGPVHGVMIHHRTGPYSTEAGMVAEYGLHWLVLRQTPPPRTSSHYSRRRSAPAAGPTGHRPS